MGVINLFSGCGGCSLGLRDAGFEIDLAVDIDKDVCQTYSANLHKKILCADISNIKPTALLEEAHLRAGELRLVVGGPPCQGFSSAGAKDWEDPRNALIKHFVDIITALKPTWFVMENVEGLLTANGGVFLIEAVSRFLQAGYWVSVKKVYMERHGLPQKRKRVFIVGNLEQCDFHFPQEKYFDQPSLFDTQHLTFLNVMDAISDLPAISENGRVLYEREPLCDYQRRLRRTDGLAVLNHASRDLNEASKQRISFIRQGETMKHLPEELQHASFSRRSKRRVMDGTSTEKRGGAPSGIKRLIHNEPSLTITSASSIEFIHPYENRPLTLRECARIQSLPDWYDFSGSPTSIATQIGNAIPPLFMAMLATHIQQVATWQRKENQSGRWLGIHATKSNGMSPALTKALELLNGRTHAYA